MESDILTLDEVHSYLKIPKPTIYALAQNGRIPAAKVGKHWRFRKGEIDDWLNAQKWSRPMQRRNRTTRAQDATN
jgi:excisionase family DNA binding protein